MNMQTVLFNGVLTFLATFGTALLTVLTEIQARGGSLTDVNSLQLAIMFIGAGMAAMAQRRGFQAPPPVKRG